MQSSVTIHCDEDGSGLAEAPASTAVSMPAWRGGAGGSGSSVIRAAAAAVAAPITAV